MTKSDQFIFDRDVFAPEIPPEDVKFSTDNQNTYGVTFTVEQPLFTGGLLTHSLNKAGKVQEKTYHRAKREKRALTFKVKKSFYEVLKERDCRKALEKLIESKETRLSVLNERQGEGYIKYDEILQLETDIAFIKTDLCRTKNREDLALSRLKELIQYVGSDEIIPKGEYFNLHFTASLQEVKDAAMKNREEVKISLSQIMATEEDIKIAESGFYPQVILKGNYSLQKETNVTLPQVWALLAQIDWPFFEWGRTRSEVIKSKTGRQRLVYEHDELQRSIRMEVEEAWRAVKDEEELVKAYDKKLKTAEYKLNLIKENYSEGKVKLIDMIEMETELIKSYTEYLTALADLAIGFAQLEASASVLDDG